MSRALTVSVLGFTVERSASEIPSGSHVGFPQPRLYVVSKDSPVLSSVEPSEVSADEAEKGTVTVRLSGSGFKPTSRVVLSLENATDLDQGGIKPEFISDSELRIDLPSDQLLIDRKWTAIRPVRLWVANGDVLHVSNAQEVRVSPSAHFPPYPVNAPAAVITQISPYPVPLIEPGSPAFTLLTVQGANFQRGESVLAVIDDKNDRRSCRLGCRVNCGRSIDYVTDLSCGPRRVDAPPMSWKTTNAASLLLVLEYEH